MEKRVRKKFNFKKFIYFIVFLSIICGFIYYICNVNLKNIIILNNTYYTDDDIIYKAKIESYPKFIFINKNTIKKKLKELDLIEDVNISKKRGFALEIDIKEKKVLYLKRSDNKYVLSDGKTIDNSTNYITPVLINYVPSEIEKSFIEAFSKIDKPIIEKVSEIEYAKSDYDEKRFLLYMNDGNEVYVNISKMESLNKYTSIISSIGNKKGILYLDNGNYFKIKEK